MQLLEWVWWSAFSECLLHERLCERPAGFQGDWDVVPVVKELRRWEGKYEMGKLGGGRQFRVSCSSREVERCRWIQQMLRKLKKKEKERKSKTECGVQRRARHQGGLQDWLALWWRCTISHIMSRDTLERRGIQLHTLWIRGNHCGLNCIASKRHWSPNL